MRLFVGRRIHSETCNPRRSPTHHRKHRQAVGTTDRRGLRRLTIDVSEDDLRAIAKRGYENAVTTDHDQQAQAVGLFLSDALLQI
jgi:hypothetical protein